MKYVHNLGIFKLVLHYFIFGITMITSRTVMFVSNSDSVDSSCPSQITLPALTDTEVTAL